MTSHPYSDERQIAIQAVQEAARLCQAVRDGLRPEALTKEDRSPVTIADFGSQALICRQLREAFPGDPIMAEEDSASLREPSNRPLLEATTRHVGEVLGIDASAEQVCSWIDEGNLAEQRERFWTLDPIDGTKGFLRGDQYAIALALIEHGEIRVGVLACPHLPGRWGSDGARGWIFAAVRGQGTERLPLRGEGPAPLRVSETREAARARFCESFVSSHSAHDLSQVVARELGITREPLRLDSQVKYAIVARGEADIYLRLPRRGSTYTERIWDHAAGALVVTEAGGKITDIHGKPLTFRHGRTLAANEGVVATNGHLHEEVLAALQEAMSTSP